MSDEDITASLNSDDALSASVTGFSTNLKANLDPLGNIVVDKYQVGADTLSIESIRDVDIPGGLFNFPTGAVFTSKPATGGPLLTLSNKTMTTLVREDGPEVYSFSKSYNNGGTIDESLNGATVPFSTSNDDPANLIFNFSIPAVKFSGVSGITGSNEIVNTKTRKVSIAISWQIKVQTLTNTVVNGPVIDANTTVQLKVPDVAADSSQATDVATVKGQGMIVLGVTSLPELDPNYGKELRVRGNWTDVIPARDIYRNDAGFAANISGGSNHQYTQTIAEFRGARYFNGDTYIAIYDPNDQWDSNWGQLKIPFYSGTSGQYRSVIFDSTSKTINQYGGPTSFVYSATEQFTTHHEFTLAHYHDELDIRVICKARAHNGAQALATKNVFVKQISGTVENIPIFSTT